MELPEWWSDKAARRRQNARSRRQERQQARSVGGKVQPGSGSSPRAPGDVRGPDFLDELKYTDSERFCVTRAVWEQHRARARSTGREPRMVIEFMTNDRPETRLVITEERV